MSDTMSTHRLATGDWMPAVRERIRRIEAEPLPQNIYALLDQAADDAPNADAIHIIASGQKLTYRALRETVNRLVNGLTAIGVRRNSHVAVMLANVVEMPITWLALARIGAVMVPVNVRYTGHELHYALTDSDVSHLVIAYEFAPLLAAMPKRVPAIEGNIVVVGTRDESHHGWQDLITNSPAACSGLPEPSIDDLMNIQYTSGTTGFPKGCLLTQQYWLTCAKAYSDCDGKSYKRILAANPFFYMTPQWLLLMAFFQRATLYIATHRSLTRYVEWIRTYRIEFCLFPFDVLTHQAPTPSDRVESMIRGNIYLHQKERHAELENRFGFPARTAFGMTEIGMGTFTPLEAAEMTGSGTCGISAPFRECRVADPEGKTLAPGTPGELLTRGPGLLKGYYRKPEATTAAFHGDWFRTGDLAVQDERGFVYIVGRLKEMIRRAGENISATEVESVLMRLPEVSETAVVPVPDDMRGEEVKAYLVLKPGLTAADLPPERVLRHCEAALAVFKNPRYIEYRSEPLPRSTSGKVQKPHLMAEKPDLRAGSWDRVSRKWV
jgi:crotonobetaine/carnitine-CoA ligase